MNLKEILGNSSNLSDRLILDHKELAKLITILKELGYRVVMTQGVYDLLHLGHIKYLEEARAHGDLLAVAIDSDRLARERKGPTRPIVPQDERLQILASLRCVDILTVTDGRERDPVDLVEVVQPDILIVSETTQDIPSERMEFFAQHAGQVVTLPAQAITTTTGRISQIMRDGAVEHLKVIWEQIGNLIVALGGEKQKKEV